MRIGGKGFERFRREWSDGLLNYFWGVEYYYARCLQCESRVLTNVEGMELTTVVMDSVKVLKGSASIIWTFFDAWKCSHDKRINQSTVISLWRLTMIKGCCRDIHFGKYIFMSVLYLWKYHRRHQHLSCIFFFILLLKFRIKLLN